MPTRRALFLHSAIMTASALVSMNFPASAEDTFPTAPAELGASRHTLDEALQAVAAEGAAPISAKFEVEDGKLWLSVYGAKGGLDHCAERNELFELKGEAEATECSHGSLPPYPLPSPSAMATSFLASIPWSNGSTRPSPPRIGHWRMPSPPS